MPPPESATCDERSAHRHGTDREVTLWHEICPEYLTMHANGGALPNECIFLMAHEFASDHFSGVLDVPSYARWLSGADLTAAYRFHRDQLKLLQWHAARALGAQGAEPPAAPCRRCSPSTPTRASSSPIATPPRRSPRPSA